MENPRHLKAGSIGSDHRLVPPGLPPILIAPTANSRHDGGEILLMPLCNV